MARLKERSNIMKLEPQILAYIESLYRKEALLLFRYANVLFENPSITEEAVQETFIIACLNHQKLTSSPNPEGWIMNTHKNVCRNIHRVNNRYIKQLISLDEMTSAPAYTEDSYNFENTVSSFVTTEDFIILKKLILDGYSHKDLAEELGISIDACKKRFQRAKQRLKQNFHDD